MPDKERPPARGVRVRLALELSLTSQLNSPDRDGLGDMPQINGLEYQPVAGLKK